VNACAKAAQFVGVRSMKDPWSREKVGVDGWKMSSLLGSEVNVFIPRDIDEPWNPNKYCRLGR